MTLNNLHFDSSPQQPPKLAMNPESPISRNRFYVPQGSLVQSHGFVLIVLVQLVIARCYAAGTVSCWGANDSLQSQVPGGLTRVTAIAAGPTHSLALKSDGTVVGWGLNDSGQSSIPADLGSVTAIAAGSNYSLALKADGTIEAWGNVPNNAPLLTNVVAIAAG